MFELQKFAKDCSKGVDECRLCEEQRQKVKAQQLEEACEAAVMLASSSPSPAKQCYFKLCVRLLRLEHGFQITVEKK
eukprot:5017817-Amphidinium_carterae.1